MGDMVVVLGTSIITGTAQKVSLIPLVSFCRPPLRSPKLAAKFIPCPVAPYNRFACHPCSFPLCRTIWQAVKSRFSVYSRSLADSENNKRITGFD
jgi:hypothetical protein